MEVLEAVSPDGRPGWLRDDSLEDMHNLPAPKVIARAIVEDLTAALSEIEAVATAPDFAR